MKKIPLGGTGLLVTKTAMGCLPVQRCDESSAIKLLRAAYEGGINYFDTANAYTYSEKKIGLALSDVRDRIVISTKSAARDKAGVLAHIENSLRMMKTDIYMRLTCLKATRTGWTLRMPPQCPGWLSSDAIPTPTE